MPKIKMDRVRLDSIRIVTYIQEEVTLIIKLTNKRCHSIKLDLKRDDKIMIAAGLMELANIIKHDIEDLPMEEGV